jgi:hypothetical protein
VGGTPPADRSGRAASLPFRAVVAATGSSCAIRRSTVPREGTRRPRVRHWRAISLQIDATGRRCLVRYRSRSTFWTIASTSSGSRPPPRPPLERVGSRSDTTPSPARHRPRRTYTWRREIRSFAAASSASAQPTVFLSASGPITSACRTAVSHAWAGAVRTPRSVTDPSAIARPSVVHATTATSTVVQATTGCPENPKFPALSDEHPDHPCTRLRTFTAAGQSRTRASIAVSHPGVGVPWSRSADRCPFPAYLVRPPLGPRVLPGPQER